MKRSPRTTLAAFLLAGVMAACRASEAPKAQVEAPPDSATIAREAHQAYVAAINSNDVETLMAALTDDIVYMPPHEMSIAGKNSVRAWAQAYFGAYKTQWEKATLEFVVAGDWAFEQYSYKSTDTPKAGGPAVTDIGKGINIYRREPDGKWRVARDAWNSDLPVPKK